MTEGADIEAMDRAAQVAACSDIRASQVPKRLYMPTETGPQRDGNGDEPYRLRDPMHAASGEEAAGISRGSDSAGKDKRGWRCWETNANQSLRKGRRARTPGEPREIS